MNVLIVRCFADPPPIGLVNDQLRLVFQFSVRDGVILVDGRLVHQDPHRQGKDKPNCNKVHDHVGTLRKLKAVDNWNLRNWYSPHGTGGSNGTLLRVPLGLLVRSEGRMN